MCTINWTRCINEIMLSVSASSWRVFCYLTQHPRASRRGAAADLGMSKNTVSDAIKALIAGGWLTATTRGDWEAPRYAINPTLLEPPPVPLSGTPFASTCPCIRDTAPPSGPEEETPGPEGGTTETLTPVPVGGTLIGISTRPQNGDDDVRSLDEISTPLPAPVVAVAEDLNHPAIRIWAAIFPNEEIHPTDHTTAAQLSMVRAQVADLESWRAAVTRWRDEKRAGRRRHGRNLAGMLNYYHQEVARKQAVIVVDTYHARLAQLEAQLARAENRQERQQIRMQHQRLAEHRARMASYPRAA